MVIVVYTSGISGNKEMKKRQQRILMVLESKNIKYTEIDITEPGREEDKLFMQEHAVATDSKHPLPPQIFNEDDYCGDYIGFDLANENDELEIFLKMPIPPPPVVNGSAPPPPPSETVESSEQQVPERNEEIISMMVPDTTSETVEAQVENGEEVVVSSKPDSLTKEDEEEMEHETKSGDEEMEDGAEGEE